MKELNWRVYLVNGDTFDSSQGEPSDVPTYPGIGSIIQADFYPIDSSYNIGSRILWEHDWFLYHDYPDYPPRWEGHDQAGLEYEVVHHGTEIKSVRQGAMIPHERWNELFKIAQNDPDFPRKSGTRSIE